MIFFSRCCPVSKEVYKISLSEKHVTRHRILERLIRRELTEKEASELLGIGVRQVRRLKKKVRLGGITSLIHGNAGKPSWNKRPASTVDAIIRIYKTRYEGFNCLHFRDMLQEREGIMISEEPLRRIFIAYDLPRKRRRTPRRFERRERKPQAGLLIQQDTSFHDWFGTGVPCALVAAIDDATSEVVFGKFFPTDGTLQNMEAMKVVTQTRGIAAAFYVDRAAHFKTTRHESIHVQLTGMYDETQIARALKEVGVTLILALSPQAKGRVERLFETLQDRLIKELALAEVKTVADGNTFLSSWLPGFNRKFAVRPANPKPAYRSLPNHLRLELIFSVQEKRVVRADNTISFHGREYLIHKTARRVSFAKTTVTFHQCIGGTMRILYHGEELAFTPSWTKSLGNGEDIIAGG